MVKKEENHYNFSDFSDSDDDAVDLKETIAAVRKLDDYKKVTPAERSEPTLKVDEFHLVKEGDEGTAVKLGELTGTLKTKFKSSNLLKELKVCQREAKTLPKPLEKPEAEKVQRTVGFEKVKTQLSHWDPVVRQNRVADHQVFPLPEPGDTFISKEDLISTIVPETDLEKRMAEILRKNNPHPEQHEDGSTVFQLTLEEMVERRKEAARLRAQQSYAVAKAHRQNKIKSKTYHRIARRERIRQQMKEFEALQQTNPEEALKRIEELEKERALERVTLRHRNTGKWARNQAVRAKYNQESRQVLSEQLKLSRDLTKKVAMDSETSEEETEEVEETNTASDNPWVNTTKTEAEVDSFISEYRKFWDGKQQPEKSSKEEEEAAEAEKRAEEEALAARARSLLKSAVVAASSSVLAQEELDDDVADSESDKESESSETSPKADPANCKNVKQNAAPKQTPKKKVDKQSESVLVHNKKGGKENVPNGTAKTEKTRSSVNSAKSTPVQFVASKSGKWKVTAKNDSASSSEQKKKETKRGQREMKSLFDNMDNTLKRKAEEKINELKRALGDGESKKKRKKKKKQAKTKKGKGEGEEVVPSGLRGEARQRPDEDVALDEGNGNDQERNPVDVNIRLGDNEKPKSLPEIDPSNFMKPVRTTLLTAVPDLIANGDEGLDDDDDLTNGTGTDQQLTISEAFADDDVVAQFEKEKNEEIDKNKAKDIDLSLPGWGSWGGFNVKPDERKRNRFIIKAPQPAKRRDENKGHVYINEKQENRLKPQQVSELPFPFKSVKDFEASVGAPISNTFIPETAHRKLVLPRVITKSGAIIKPMTKEVLSKRRAEKRKKMRADIKESGKKERGTEPRKVSKSK